MYNENQCIKNSIWKFMKKRDYCLKQVAFLMGFKGLGQISCWVRGRKIPSLENALKLSITLNTPTEFLFHGQFQKFKNQINRRREKLFAHKIKLGKDQ